MATITVGVIGCGGIYQNQHAPCYRQTDRAEIAAVADIDEQTAREQADAFEADAYTDFRELLEREDIDAVDICTHPAAHRDAVVAAADAGKHVLVEKPMSRTVDEADEMIAAADEAGVLLQVAYVLRFRPTYERLKKLLESDELGELHLAYGNRIGWFEPSHPWLFEKEESGGMLVEQAIHQLDAWLWLYGPVSSVYAKVSHVPLGGAYPEPSDAVENNATIIFEFENGGTGVYTKSWAAEIGHSSQGVVCSNGSASLEGSELRWKLHDGDEQSFADDESERLSSKGRSIDHWLKCIAGEKEPTTTGEVGREGIALAEAAYRSSETGTPVEP